MANLQGLLASLLNPNPGMGGLLSPAGYQQQTGLGPEQLQRYHAMSGMGGAAPATPPPPPALGQGTGARREMGLGQPDQTQTASTRSSGGIGDFLGNLLAPKSAQKNRTVQLLMEDGLDEGTATLVAQDKGSLQHYLRQRAFGGGEAVDPLEAEYKRAQIDNMRSQITERNNPNARDKFGNSVIWGQGPDGKWVAMQPSNSGGLVPADTPEGITLVPPGVANLDLGNQFGIRDRAGNIISTVDKNLAAAEADKVTGKGQGEAIESWRSMTSKMPGLETVVTELDTLADQATYTLAGKAFDYGRAQVGMEPREAAIARTKYTAIVDNQVLPLLRDTFGAQFTVQEGESLRKTLGDPDKTPAEKQEVLKAFIEQKRRDVEALAARTGQSSPAAPTATPSADGDWANMPPPEGIEPEVWKHVPAEKRALWRQ